VETNDVAVATITWARTEAEEALLRRSLGTLAAAGLPVALADKGNSAAFSDFVKHLDGFSVTVPREQGLVTQVQASLALAAGFGRRWILYVESDKQFFFEHRMGDFLHAVPDDRTLGVALASRSPESYDTFPPMQHYTEGVINHLCTELLGVAGDYSYGPFTMNAALLPHVASLQPGLGWGWRHSTFLAAQRHGLRVMHVTSDYPCPSDQRAEDTGERTHRMRQLSQNILGLIA